MAQFNPEDYISDQTFERIKYEHKINSCYDWVPKNKTEIYNRCFTEEARQQIIVEYLVTELDRIADKIIEAIKK